MVVLDGAAGASGGPGPSPVGPARPVDPDPPDSGDRIGGDAAPTTATGAPPAPRLSCRRRARGGPGAGDDRHPRVNGAPPPGSPGGRAGPNPSDAGMAREVFLEVATLLHDGLALDGLDEHDAASVVDGLCVDLVAADPAPAVRARARATSESPGDLHDPQGASAAYLMAAAILQL